MRTAAIIKNGRLQPFLSTFRASTIFPDLPALATSTHANRVGACFLLFYRVLF
jgi:hypothetical protein